MLLDFINLLLLCYWFWVQPVFVDRCSGKVCFLVVRVFFVGSCSIRQGWLSSLYCFEQYIGQHVYRTACICVCLTTVNNDTEVGNFDYANLFLFLLYWTLAILRYYRYAKRNSNHFKGCRRQQWIGSSYTSRFTNLFVYSFSLSHIICTSFLNYNQQR